MLEEPSITHLPASRIGEAVIVLRDAFLDDPIFGFHFPDPILRAKVLQIFFDGIVRTHFRFGQIYAATQGSEIVGASVWRPPNAMADTLRDQLRNAFMRFRLMARSPKATNKLMRGFRALEATHPGGPYWYLFFIGIDSRFRGRGVGTQLMAPVLKIADATRCLCYLETPFSNTHAFYRGLGYEISSELLPFPGATQLWAMTRRPSPAEPS